MADFESMSIEELEAFRAERQQEIGAARAQFKEAGAVLERKRAETPKAQALRKMSEAREELARLAQQEE